MLPAPNLDDRTFQDLVDDAKRLVQQRCPTWTDHNVSDPGVTLIEAVAQMIDQLIYRLNRVPDLNYIKFLELIGVELRPPLRLAARRRSGCQPRSRRPYESGPRARSRPRVLTSLSRLFSARLASSRSSRASSHMRRPSPTSPRRPIPRWPSAVADSGPSAPAR